MNINSSLPPQVKQQYLHLPHHIFLSNKVKAGGFGPGVFSNRGVGQEHFNVKFGLAGGFVDMFEIKRCYVEILD